MHRLEVQFRATALIKLIVAESQYQFFQGYREILADLICRINQVLSWDERWRVERYSGYTSVFVALCKLL